MERSRGVDAVLVGDELPELGANLVTALACLQMDDFSHLILEGFAGVSDQNVIQYLSNSRILKRVLPTESNTG